IPVFNHAEAAEAPSVRAAEKTRPASPVVAADTAVVCAEPIIASVVLRHGAHAVADQPVVDREVLPCREGGSGVEEKQSCDENPRSTHYSSPVITLEAAVTCLVMGRNACSSRSGRGMQRDSTLGGRFARASGGTA